MRLERAGINQIKIFVTFDELAAHGLSKDEVGKDNKKWNHLLTKIIDRANDEFDLLMTDTVVVDIFLFQSQEIVFVVTLIESDDGMLENESDYDEYLTYNNEVEGLYLFEFQDVEDVIQYAIRTNTSHSDSELYYLNNKYYLMIRSKLDIHIDENLISEYGSPSKLSIYYIKEYGKIIVEKNVVATLKIYFAK